MEMEDASEVKPRQREIIMGLDYGTTFLGVAWCLHDPQSQRKSEGDIQTVRGWSVHRGNTQRYEVKVPSKIRFKRGDATEWGYEVADCDENTLEWMKLCLTSDKYVPSHLRQSSKLKEARKKMRNLGLNATQVTEKYMEKVWTHALNEIKKSVRSEEFELIPIHVVITIPAIWGNSAIEMMKTAVGVSILQSRPAGLITYEFLSEPEAAVQAYAGKPQLALKLGEIVMVADLGGGTGDFISYQKVGNSNEAGLELREAAPGDGDLCGAIFADEAFENLLFRKLPTEYKNLSTNKPNLWRKLLLGEWQQNIKRNFKWEGTGRIWPVCLSTVNDALDVQLHEEEIREVFDTSVIPKILGLFGRQIEAVKKAHDGEIPRIVLPVGGFGQCPYVLQRLEEEIERINRAFNGTGKTIKMIEDTQQVPWSAVCEGACQFGLHSRRNNRLVKSRLSRTSVGFILPKPASAEEGGLWHPDFGIYMIPNDVKYLIKKGDSIDADKKWTMPMYLARDPSIEGTVFEESTFYAYDDDSPPKLYDEYDPGFREYGVLTITASKPGQKLRLEDSDGGGSRIFDYNLEVEIVGGSVQVTATSAIPDDGGKQVGKLVLPQLDTM